MALDLVTIGRSSVDVYPLQDATPLDRVTSFGKFLGGSPTNVAVAAARHGLRSAVITRTGDDPFGRYIHDEVARLGVDPSFVSPIPGGQTPVTFCEIFPPDSFPLYFYRDHAPDLRIEPDELPLDAIREAGIYWSTVSGLSREPSRAAHFTAWEARDRRTWTVLDLDYRPGFWTDADEARRVVRSALPFVDVAVGNREECEIAVGETDPERAAAALLDAGVRLAIVKLGPDGVLARTADETTVVRSIPVQVVNGLGAGDGFGGALCSALLRHWDLRLAIEFANAAGAIVATRRECSTAMPTTAEVEALLGAAT